MSSTATLVVVPPSQVAREVEISEGIISIGRAMDNTISVEGDSSISRYHAEIESRDDGFWVYDLGSSNGTTVNDEPVKEDRLLKDGDTIGVGGETYIEFHYGKKKTFKDEEEEQKPASSAASSASSVQAPAKPTPAAPAAPSSGVPVLLIIAGIIGGLAILAVGGVVLWMIFGSSCPGEVTLLNPKGGAVLTGPTKIQVDFQKGDEKCIDRVIYQIDGNSFPELEVESAPYEATLNPESIPAFSDGGVHVLTIIVEDLSGNKKVQNQAIKLSYNPGGAPPPSPDANPSLGSTPQGGNQNGGDAPPVQGNPQTMGQGLSTKIAGRTGYILTPQFMTLVNARTGEYRSAGGAGSKAQTFKREINKAFRDKGVNPLIGYTLAMSRSKFNLNAKGTQGELGLWQIPPAVVRGPNHLTTNEQDTALADPKRGAEIAAAYLNDLIGRFGNEGFMYAIACFGMSLEDVGKFRLQLEKADPNGTLRLDFMQMVKAGIVTPEMQERVVKFMAAGIVGDNPQAFGLSDPPLSSL